MKKPRKLNVKKIMTLSEKLHQSAKQKGYIEGFSKGHHTAYLEYLDGCPETYKRGFETAVEEVKEHWERAIFYSELGKGKLDEQIMKNHLKSLDGLMTKQ